LVKCDYNTIFDQKVKKILHYFGEKPKNIVSHCKAMHLFFDWKAEIELFPVSEPSIYNHSGCNFWWFE